MSAANKLQVWHLIGPQGCGKGLFARMAADLIESHGGKALWLDSHEFGTYYAGNPERVKDAHPGTTVLMIEVHTPDLPGYTLCAGWEIDLTNYLHARQPAAYYIAVALRLLYPDWTGKQAMHHAKLMASSKPPQGEATC